MSYGSFSGNPKTEWLSEVGHDRSMKLLEDFSYVDAAGRQWKASKGSVVDGASIPEALWSSVGSPFTGEYRRASIVHDIACGAPEIDRSEADDMFYWACLSGGCSKLQAKMLYLGVRIGSWASGVDGTGAPEILVKPRLSEEHSRSELLMRAKYTILADQLAATPDDFDLIKSIVDRDLAR